MELNKCYCGDCLDLMKDIPDKSIDMILCDLPYGTTECKWDTIIPFEPLWEQYKRIIKDNGAIVLTASQPFTTDLINSARDIFKYELIWEKTNPTGFFNAKKMPLKIHENILIFYSRLPTYNPTMKIVNTDSIGRIRINSKSKCEGRSMWGKVSEKNDYIYVENGTRYPTSIIKYSNWNGASFGDISKTIKHPTHKPIPLFEYLIKTYTNEGDLVLDNCVGSGTTAIACINTRRNFIGIEKDEEYFNIAQKWVKEAQGQKRLDL